MTIGMFVFAMLILAVLIYATAAIIEWTVIKRIMSNPAKGMMCSVALSGLTFVVIFSTSMGLSPGTVVAPLLATMLVVATKVRQYRRVNAEYLESSNLDDVFD